MLEHPTGSNQQPYLFGGKVMATSALSPISNYSQPSIDANTETHLTFVNSDFESQLKTQMEKFTVYLITNRGLGSGTINNYQKVAQKILKEIGVLTPSHEQIQERVVWLYSQKYSYSHIVNTIRGIEAYMVFINRPIRFGRPKRPKRIIQEALTEAEISVIISACRNIRERAILTLLAYSGIRNAELCGLRVRDVDFGGNVIHIIQGKGSKSRTVCISGDCTRVLLEYLGRYPRSENEFLFTTLRTGRQYSTYALRQLVKTVSSRTNIHKRVYPHIFRHSLATAMLNRGANLLTIKEQLGHADIETTMIYIKSSTQRIRSEYQLFVPSYV